MRSPMTYMLPNPKVTSVSSSYLPSLWHLTQPATSSFLKSTLFYFLDLILSDFLLSQCPFLPSLLCCLPLFSSAP